MDRIKSLFQRKQKNILSIYFTAGYPQLDDTATIIKALTAAGADMIEIGIPFSDPVADGPTIQASNTVALQNGMTVSLLFQQLKDIRQHTDIPLILMGYLNPIMQYGIATFCKQAKDCGIDGLIIPDLPLPEYEKEYKDIFQQNGLHLIFLITPQTSAQRIQLIDSLSDSFIYMVATSATTGKQVNFTAADLQPLKDIQQQQLKNPILAGFGIHDKQTFLVVTQYVQGGIIGSSFIRAISNGDVPLETSITNFVNTII